MDAKWIGLCALMLLLLGCTAPGPGAIYGGTSPAQSPFISNSNLKLISASPLDLSQGGKFTRTYLTDIQINSNNGQLVQGAVSSNLKDTDASDGKISKQGFVIGAKLNSMSCDYPTNDYLAVNHDIATYSLANVPSPSWKATGSGGIAGAGCQNDLYGIIGRVYSNSQIPASTDSKGVKYYGLTDGCARDFNSYCIAQGTGYVVLNKDAVSADYWASSAIGKVRACVRLNPSSEYYKVYNVQPMKPSFNVTIGIRHDNGTEEYDTISQNKKIINTPNMYVDFSSLDFTGQQFCPSETGIVLMQKISSAGGNTLNTYVLHNNLDVLNGLYSSVISARDGLVISSADAQPGTAVSLYNAIDAYNNEISSQLSSPYSSFVTKPADSSYRNGYVSIDRTSSAPFNVNAQMMVNADWIGIVIPKATPKITGIMPNSLTLISGRQGGSVQVSIYNTNDFQGNFYSDMSQCPFNPIWSPSPDGSYGPYQTKVASMTIPTSNVGVGQTCTIKVCSGVALTGEAPVCDSASFGVNVQNACIQTCPIGKVRVSQDTCDCVCQTTSCPAGQKLDQDTCRCVNQQLTCPDNTAVGQCNAKGQRCNVYGSLADDCSCNNTCAQPAPAPAPAPGPGPVPPSCPLLKKVIYLPSGGVNFFDMNFFGTQIGQCDWDPLSVGAIFIALGAALAYLLREDEKLMLIGLAIFGLGLLMVVWAILAGNVLLVGLLAVIMLIALLWRLTL